MIRDLRLRQVRDHFLPQLQRAPGASALATEMANAMAEVQRDSVTSLELKLTWLTPPFARRSSWLARAQWRSETGATTYRLSRGLARDLPRWMWYVPIL